MDRPQVGRSIALLNQLVLPGADVCYGDFIHPSLSKVREQLIFDHIPLVDERMLTKAVFHIIHIDDNEVRKFHVKASDLLEKECTQPFFGFALGLEATLGGLAIFACPVLISVLDQPFSGLGSRSAFNDDTSFS